MNFSEYVRQRCMNVIPAPNPDPEIFLLAETLGAVIDQGEGIDGVVTVGKKHYAEPALVAELLQVPRSTGRRMEKEEAEKLTADHTVTIIAGGKRYVDIEMTLRFLPALYAAAQQKGG
ncbi:MAG: hypothetical protein IJG67_00605 [Oscillospiraceae bacterium]|nr:hypothetical protein [Oscillospiraceae bacterium]